MICLSIIFSSSFCFSQQRWRLEPSIGLQTLFCTLQDKSEADPSLEANFFDVHPEFGLSVRYSLNHNGMIIGGWKNGGASFSYKFENSTSNNGIIHRSIRRSNTVSQVQRFHLAYSHNLSRNLYTRSINKYGLTINKYFGMNIRFLIGASFDNLVQSSDEGVWFESNSLTPISGSEIKTARRKVIKSRYIASVLSGVSFDFHNTRKHIITINLNYSRGLSTLFNGELVYSLNGENYRARFQSRGSFLSLGISYPLKLFKTEEDKINQQM